MEINSQRLDENAKSDSESDIDIDTKPLHNGIEDILDAEYSDNSSTSGDEDGPRFKNCWNQIFFW